MLNPSRRESTRENGKGANGLVRTAVRGNGGGDEDDVEDVQCSATLFLFCVLNIAIAVEFLFAGTFGGQRGEAASLVSTLVP